MENAQQVLAQKGHPGEHGEDGKGEGHPHVAAGERGSRDEEDQQLHNRRHDLAHGHRHRNSACEVVEGLAVGVHGDEDEESGEGEAAEGGEEDPLAPVVFDPVGRHLCGL